MIHPQQLGDERLPDPFDIAQGQVALVELAVIEPLLDDPRDHRPDGHLVARGQGTDRGLHAVGQHDQGRLARLRLGADVAVARLVHRLGRLVALGGALPAERRGGELPSPSVEVADERGPVMLRDERDERLGQVRPVGNVDPVRHVALEDLGGRLRIELVVDVVAAGLVLDERQRVGQLPHIVVVGCHAGKQRIRTNRLGRPLGQVGHHDRVVVRAGRLHEQPAEQLLGWVGQLQQLERREDSEHVAQHRERADRGHRGPTAGRRRGAPQLQDPGHVALAKEGKRGDHHGVHDRDGDPGLDERVETVASPNRHDAGERAEEDVRRHLDRARAQRTGDDRHDRAEHDRRACIEQQRHQDAGGGGRQEERQDRAAGRQLQAERREHQQQPDQGQHVGAVPELRPESPDPGQQQTDHQGREERPASQPDEIEPSVRQAECRDLLVHETVDRIALAHDHLALAERHRARRDKLGGAIARLIRERLAVRRVGHEERPDKLSGEGALARLQATQNPSRQPVTDIGHVRIAQLVRLDLVEHAGRLGPDHRPAVAGHGLERRPTVRAELWQDGLEQGDPLLVGDRRRERGVDRGDQLGKGQRLLTGNGRGLLRCEVVLRGDRCASRQACLVGQDCAVEGQRARGRDVRPRNIADLGVHLARHDVHGEDAGHGQHEQCRGDEQPAEVAAGEGRLTVGPLGEHRSVAAVRVVGDQVGPGQRLDDQLAGAFAVGTSAGAWGEPTHDLAQVAGGRGTGGRDGLVDQRGQLVVREGLWHELAEDGDLRFLPGHEIRAVARLEGVNRFAPGLHLAAEYLEFLVRAEWPALLLLDGVQGVADHPQHVAAQRVTRPHRGRRFSLEAFLEGHRSSGTSGGELPAGRRESGAPDQRIRLNSRDGGRRSD